MDEDTQTSEDNYSQLLKEYYEKRNEMKKRKIERNVEEMNLIQNDTQSLEEEEKTEYTFKDIYHYYPFLETDYQYIPNLSDFIQQQEEYKKYYFYLIHKQNGIYYKGIFHQMRNEEDNIWVEIKNKMGKTIELNIQHYFLFYKIYQATGSKSNLRLSLEPFLHCVSLTVKKKKEINQDTNDDSQLNSNLDVFMEVLEEEDTNDLFEKINPND